MLEVWSLERQCEEVVPPLSGEAQWEMLPAERTIVVLTRIWLAATRLSCYERGSLSPEPIYGLLSHCAPTMKTSTVLWCSQGSAHQSWCHALKYSKLWAKQTPFTDKHLSLNVFCYSNKTQINTAWRRFYNLNLNMRQKNLKEARNLPQDHNVKQRQLEDSNLSIFSVKACVWS